MAALFNYRIMLYFEISIYKVVVFNNLSFLLHVCYDIARVELGDFLFFYNFFSIIEGYTTDEESYRELQE